MAEHFRLRTVFFCFVEKTDTSQDLTNSTTDLKKDSDDIFSDKIRYLVKGFLPVTILVIKPT